MKNLFLTLGMLAMIGGGCVGGSADSRLRYVSTNTTVTTGEGFASAWFTAEGLAGQSKECGINHDVAYYQTFVDRLADQPAYNYFFTADGDVQDPTSWTVTLIPNVTGYTSMKAFRDDFEICAAGGQAYPLMLNENWLVFSDSCGSGYDDGTNREVGCEAARRQTTLTMNPPAFADDRE